MEAGIELDKIIAQKMGWKFEPYNGEECLPSWLSPSQEWHFAPPAFSTSMIAAWDVLCRFGLSIEQKNDKWTVYICSEEGSKILCTENSASLAICLGIMKLGDM